MNGCFDNQLPAVVFDGVKTSRMLSCQVVTIGRDVRGVASLAWGGVHARVVTGQWSTTPRNPSPRHPAHVHRQCWIIQCELWAFVLFLELFVLIGNRPIIGWLFGTDYRLTDNRPVRYRCIPTFDPESGVQVTCDVGYLCANFGLPRPLCSRVTPNVCDRQTSDKSITFMPLPIRGGA